MNHYFRANSCEPPHERVIRSLINFSAATLFGISLAALLGIQASAATVAPPDPVLMISTRAVFLIFAGAGLAVACICLFARDLKLRLAVILWLAINAAVYALAIRWSGSRDLSPYLGNLTAAFRLSPAAGSFLLEAAFLCLLIASALPLLWLQLNQSRLQAQAPLKMSCPACGVHVQFPTTSLGQKTECPGCGANITLRKPGETLKMSCFFCHEHIEFPAHALGRRIKCPHCKKEVGLKEETL